MVLPSDVADISAVVSPLLELLAPLLGQALRAFLRTTVGMICLGGVLAVASFVVAARVSPLHGLLAVVAALALCAVLGTILATKRAVGATLSRGIRELGVARKTTTWLFAQMLGVDERGVVGARGGVVATTLERLPLAQAEQRLADVVQRAVAPDPAATGLRAWLARKLQRRLLDVIQRVTAAEFRTAAAGEGGVDLVRVRDGLADRMDTLLHERVEGGTRSVTVLLIGAAVALSIAASVAISRIPL